MRIRIRERGFTLIELLVVLAIISLLLTVALPRYFGSVEKSREAALKENLKVLRVGIDRFYADKGEYPAALADLVTHHYFRAIPLDPVTESDKTWQPVNPRDSEKSGIADVRSGAKGNARDGTPYAQL
ncbi:type IV pilin protein [Pseudoduganella namucuonensis]|uniref:Type II secretion system protein G (GspG) n=1 Tax=Pseudoduganella namucuonensis TaxID=1035707 RepID=A0A1I7JWE9_9BURK|nr:type II secretion system protein [Pseudoduganella namucuonensis]SFU89522.1 type II secretion system protein G (GspG) [Pseudoduganella namucuonensis]